MCYSFELLDMTNFDQLSGFAILNHQTKLSHPIISNEALRNAYWRNIL